MSDMLTLSLDPGEASALSYFVAFAALHHDKRTPHEERLITKVSRLDPDAFTMWREGVMRASGNAVGREKVSV